MIFVISAIGSVFLQLFLNTSGNEELRSPITIIEKDESLDTYLRKFKKTIGKKDYKGYKGHCYRVLSYALHYLRADKSIAEATLKDKLPAISAAIAYHDIGLWTDRTLKYIEPSCDRARIDLKTDFFITDVNLIVDIIYWHHKVTEYDDEGSNDLNRKIIEAVRKADWIDATFGFIPKGMPKAHIKTVMEKIAEEGFHDTLINFGPKLYGYDVMRIATELSSIFKP